MKESKFKKFWENYGYLFFIISGIGLFLMGEKLLGSTYLLLAISFYGLKD